MSVYTTIDTPQLQSFLSNYNVGELVDFEGISDGIENTNYFVNTSQGRFVLTIFEQHSFEEMQYYLNLMHHLADHKVPSANPVADNDGQYLSHFKDKPIALVERLDGGSITRITVDHCRQLGAAMGKMHSAGLSFSMHQDNPRGPEWCAHTAQRVKPKISAADQQVLDVEIEFQKLQRHAEMPRGVIHADLFRDNALWASASKPADTFSGIIDFYYSCDDVLLYDLAVTANDWCSNDNSSLDQEKVRALLSAYNEHRVLTEIEQQYWPAMLRAGALRFWLSRLQDKHFPREGELVHTKNPDEFKAILCDRVTNGETYLNFWL